jgi:hypothetical protein
MLYKMKTWEEKFNEIYVKDSNWHLGKAGTESLKSFIQSEVDKIEEQWEVAVLNNVDNETWNRIKNALIALKK